MALSTEIETVDPPFSSEITETPADDDGDKAAIVRALYAALAAGDSGKVGGIVAGDLEWWFHGPQKCHHMMNMLTGKSTAFRFEPRSVDVIEDRVIVEGWEGAQAYWVHVWTIQHGLITQFREYFNTWLTVTELRRVGRLSSSTVWWSHPRDLAKRSLPGLMLTI
ncbi:wound-induced protein 1-like [Ipomoea triloba]|uniref:wound-induced protein 1-like n=1 Tax=Ipomoea triloba TaxID=35885 RepID=UPI00125E5C67|nr:wound-induced protein 1-like [Ipomoea triloba]